MAVGDYRIVEKQPSVFTIQKETVIGFVDVETATSAQSAAGLIQAFKAQDKWTPKFYDERGNLMAPVEPPANQPVDGA